MAKDPPWPPLLASETIVLVWQLTFGLLLLRPPGEHSSVRCSSPS